MLPILFKALFLTSLFTLQIFTSQNSVSAFTKLEKSQFKANLPTVTVRGFLNFRTTVDGTIIVFTPASAANESPKSLIQQPSLTVEPPQIYSTRKVEIRPTSTIENVRSTPVPEILSSKRITEQYPTGLVTVLKGAVVHNGATTIYETKVIGTYINGKYAQVLKSTSSVNNVVSSSVIPKIQASNTRSIVLPTPLPTAKPPKVEARTSVHKPKSLVIKPRPNTDNDLTHNKPPIFESKDNTIQPSFKNREYNQLHAEPTTQSSRTLRQRFGRLTTTESPTTKRVKIRVPGRASNRRVSWTPRQSQRVSMNRFKVKVPTLTSREKVEEEAAKQINKRFQNRFGLQKPKDEPKEKKDEIKVPTISNAAYKPPILDLESNEEITTSNTPQIEPHRVVKEVQTITSEITQHIDGNNIKVDTTTWVTTVQRTVHPSEFDGQASAAPTILPENNDIDATSIAETPPIVISRTYSVTERSMRTTVVPVFDGTLTTNHTVTESFFIRKLITAYKTMPPGDIQLLETASMEMNNISYIDNMQATNENIQPSVFEGTVEFRDTDDENSIHPTTVGSFNGVPTLEPSSNQNQNQLPPFAQIDLNNPLIVGAALRNPQVAALYFGLQQMKQQAPHYETVTKPTAYLTKETLFNTKTISFHDGRQSRTRMITEPGSVVDKTVRTFVTEVTPVINPQYYLQQAQLQQILATQLLNPAAMNMAQQTAPLHTFTTVTTSTSTSTKIYTLIYNAFSTRYRTVTSTSLIPTTITTSTAMNIGNTINAFNPFFG